MQSKVTKWFTGLGCLTPVFGFILLGYFFFNRSFLLGIVALVVSFLAGFIVFGIVSEVEDKRKVKQKEFLRTFKPAHFDSDKHKSFTSEDLLSKIAIDEQQEIVYLWTPHSKKGEIVTRAYPRMPYIINAYDYSDILAINLKFDNHQTASVQRNTHYTNFFLNKIKEEDAANSDANNQSVDRIRSMDLEIIVDDHTKPRHLIRFNPDPTTYLSKDSLEYYEYLNKRQEWFTKLQFIIEQKSDVAQKNERPIETGAPSLCAAPTNEFPVEIKTRILIADDTKQYSLLLHEESEDTIEVSPEIEQIDTQHEQAVEKPMSYFEQLVEKNRRQLRGDSTDKQNE
ncbi:hypothetical protein [Sporosarcina sp. Marseille-Q4943]|uniref:hypothetical protein n=1 Tax=Sporosarcina sp. Marseille-Q4943 TaxID=2942204 RepID=UPI00208DCACC|nr:hypothetical protein [Sporosarcina sp. Marseille-Q4943]